MATIERFEDIQAWQTARDLTRLVYSLTGEGAFARDYGLKDQLRRAAASSERDPVLPCSRPPVFVYAGRRAHQARGAATG